MRDRAGCRESQRDRTGERRPDPTAGPALDRERMPFSIVFGESAHATTKGRGAKVHPPNHRFGQVAHTSTGGRAAKVDPLLYGRADLARLADVPLSGRDSMLDELGHH